MTMGDLAARSTRDQVGPRSSEEPEDALSAGRNDRGAVAGVAGHYYRVMRGFRGRGVEVLMSWQNRSSHFLSVVLP